MVTLTGSSKGLSRVRRPRTLFSAMLAAGNWKVASVVRVIGYLNGEKYLLIQGKTDSV